MGLRGNLRDMRGSRYQGIASSKEADSAFKPLSRPRKADWPTLVIESGVSEKLPRLRVDARWWLENSSGDVNIVLLFSISEAAQMIHLEKWELVSVPNLQVTPAHPQPFVMTPTQTDHIDIVQPIAAGGALTLDFAKIFLRQPVQGGLEGNMIFTTLDLEGWADGVWQSVQ
ncbi:hypothetical protein L873DRAFT_1845854 [Choiromyces venosus 120613-1]|uniref:Uncharacterized protein n=1 Tax=Choiromyces venosus 120613-1 TaxID=1336337 RepID=A0A3N4JC01_9PEZI|nr:hypothetical protein L873DRAFT_1845854 [Choiromyces venosus 120613-1]